MEDITSNNAFLALSMPLPHSATDVQRGLQQWNETAERQEVALAQWMREASGNGHHLRRLLEGVLGNSPYLSRLLLLYPDILRTMALQGADGAHAMLMEELKHNKGEEDRPSLMQHLRCCKGRLALLVALADVSGVWNLEKVTGALSDFAQACLIVVLDHLLRVAHKRGEITLPDAEHPSRGSGVIVLGMGKLGGRELNYSSDIDLIVFFERGRLSYKGRHNEQHFMNRLAQDLVAVMQERTAQGYVFRTDLRLRPDPASTPPAVTTEAAYYYYESVGQNWERAAMIKARPVAGDIEAGERFLKGIAPFMWRKSLDFASINDIHSIKRQMDSANRKTIQVRGHNVKLGLGGIREIEFYTQIHQLIWGGKQPGLRTRPTCVTLERLTELGLIDKEKETLLLNAYGFLRKIEHRLQMIGDQQTHNIPEDKDGVAHVAHFMGYASVEAFEHDVLKVLKGVHDIYASSFRGAEQLGDAGNLVFTGVSHDPETLETLHRMGYSSPETVSEIVMGWHHGSRRATRTKRARELLTELMPILLKRLAETANPDAAFLKFNDFLSNLPAGVQLFSLFTQNPHLLSLIADIMGSAPQLADTLAKSPELLDAVLHADFYNPLPSSRLLTQQLAEVLKDTDNFEERMDALTRFRNEKRFQAGVQMLRRMVTAQEAGVFLSALADVAMNVALDAVTEGFIRTYGTIRGGRFAVIALGKLGSREMTFSSDIDLVFVYDAEPDAVSDGPKKFDASVYFNRLAQRFLNALTAMGREGRLYEVDTRLRPSGEQGLLAVSRKALAQYFDESAWTFEYMAFTKARPVAGDVSLKDELNMFIRHLLSRSRDREKLCADAMDMRARIEKEHGTTDIWNIKYVRGGLIDIDFIAQYLLLRYAPDTPEAQAGSASQAFTWLKRHGRLDGDVADDLIAHDHFLGQIFNMLRLCSDHAFDETSAPPGIKKILFESVGEQDFEALKARLIRVEEEVYSYYLDIIEQAS